jgi:transglutaminase-like putative cysteine protease
MTRSRPWAAELLLAAAILLAATPLSQLLTDGSWALLVGTAVLVVCGSGALLRTVLHRPLLVVALQAVCLLGLWEITRRGTVPAGASASAEEYRMGEVLGRGFQEVLESRPPVTAGPEASLLLLVLVGLVVFALDVLFVDGGWCAATAGLLLSFMVVPALMAPDGGPWYTIAGPVAGAALALAAPLLLGARARAVGATLAVLVLVAGATPVLTGTLPRIQDPPFPLDMDRINAWQGRNVAGYEPVMIDDSISVRRDLMRGEEVEVLRYRTDAENLGYLRMRTLTSFDGENFLSPRRSAGMDLETFSDRTQAGSDPTGLTHTDIRLTNLAGDHLPAPANIRWTDPKFSGNPTSGELVLEDAQEIDSYTVASEELEVSAEDLRSVPENELTAPYSAGYISVRAPEAVRDQAREVIADADAEGAYDSALALEDWFHTFDYSLNVRSQPGEDPLTSFLEDRVGYCEQFAGTFAVMMNSLGYPTRVAIGFTAGEQDGGDGTDWSVTTHNAHAWPEVYFGPDYGWVRFEPTPAAADNGVQEQAIPEQSTTDEPDEVTDAPTETGEDDVLEPETSSTEETSSEEEESSAPVGTAHARLDPGAVALRVLAAMVVVAGIGLAVLARARTLARERHWEATTGVDAAVELALTELDGALATRARRVRWWGWTRRFGPFYPVTLVRDRSLAPAPALADLIRQAEDGGLEVEERHRAAAVHLGEIAEVSRYAPQPPQVTVAEIRQDADALRDLVLVSGARRARAGARAPR